MNWLAFDLRAYAAALLACIAAAFAALHLDAVAASLPWLVGLVAGLACAAAARDRSGLRGLVVAAMAVWTGAIVDAQRAEDSQGLGRALLRFHDSLTPLRVAGYVLGFGLAVALARLSLRRGARDRIAGA